MAIEVISKGRFDMSIWARFLLIVFLVSVVAFSVHYFYLDKEATQINQKLKISPPEEALRVELKKKETEIALINNKINSFAGLFSDHKNIGKIFEFIEKNCFPEVWFSSFSFQGGKIKVSGAADNFTTIGQQILFLKQQPQLANIILSELSLGKEGGVVFSLTLDLNPQVFD